MNKLKTIDREAVSWKCLFKIQKITPLKQFGKHYLDRRFVHASEIGWAHGKIQHKIHLKLGHTFCNFSLAPKRKIYKTSMKHLKIHKFPFKNVIVLAIECKMYLKIQQKLRWLGCISKQTMGSAVKKTRLNSSKDDFLMKSFPFSTKRKLSILLNFLFRCIFNLEMQNSCLKTSAWWSRSSHFVENGYPSLRFSNMVKMNIHEHWTRVTRFNQGGY